VARSQRFGPAHSASERSASTAERFGVGRAAAHDEADLPNDADLANDAALAPEPDAEPGANNHAPAFAERRAPRRPLRAQRYVFEDLPEDEEEEAAYAPPAFDDAGAAGDYEEPGFGDAEFGDEQFGGHGDDPVTAPVPALDFVIEDYEDYGNDPLAAFAAGGDQVLIRAGQAGEADDQPSSPASKATSAAEERRGRRRLRRRNQGS
jgi:hypothetical protein